MNTQCNEALNTTISYKAPKNKHFSGSVSLRNRVDMGVSTHFIGRAEFFRKLYTSVGVNIRPGTERYLENQDRAFQYRKQKQKKPATKKKRNELKFQKLRIQLQELQKNRKKKHHYESGVAMLLVDTVSIVENDSTIVTISEPNKLPRNAAEEEALWLRSVNHCWMKYH